MTLCCRPFWLDDDSHWQVLSKVSNAKVALRKRKYISLLPGTSAAFFFFHYYISLTYWIREMDGIERLEKELPSAIFFFCCKTYYSPSIWFCLIFIVSIPTSRSHLHLPYTSWSSLSFNFSLSFSLFSRSLFLTSLNLLILCFLPYHFPSSPPPFL